MNQMRNYKMKVNTFIASHFCFTAIVLFGSVLLIVPFSLKAEQAKSVQISDIVYAGKDGDEVHLDLYIPVSKPPVPVIVYIHGGAFQTGSKSAMFIDTDLFTSRDYAVASIDYRLYPNSEFPAQIHDCKAAIRWLRANGSKYGIDPSRIGVLGESAGGYLAVLLGVTNGLKELEGDRGFNSESSRVDAVCDMYAPVHVDVVNKMPDPLKFISESSPPFLIIHGKKDSIVQYKQSEILNNALSSAHISSELILIDKADHGNLTPELLFSIKNMNRIMDFFDRTIKGKSK